jgi:prepilin-type N-terminal cleavage/methylation domain-containing protein
MIRIKNSKGFTLVELLIAMIALGIFILFATGIYFNVLRSTARQNIQTEIRQNGELALNMVLADIRNATTVYPEDGTSRLAELCNNTPRQTLSMSIGEDYVSYRIHEHERNLLVDSIEKRSCGQNGCFTRYIVSPSIFISPGTNGLYTCSYTPSSGVKITVSFTAQNAAATTPIPGKLEEFGQQDFRGYAVARYAK